DTLHFSGGNATLDALHSGVPVVTCPGRFMRARQSAAMLRMLGCSELIARTPLELARIAADVAADTPRRLRLGRHIRENLPALTTSELPLIALDTVLRELLRDLRPAAAS